jgi:hypothetical protein
MLYTGKDVGLLSIDFPRGEDTVRDDATPKILD